MYFTPFYKNFIPIFFAIIALFFYNLPAFSSDFMREDKARISSKRKGRPSPEMGSFKCVEEPITDSQDEKESLDKDGYLKKAGGIWRASELHPQTPIALKVKSLSSCYYHDKKTKKDLFLEEKEKNYLPQILEFVWCITNNKWGWSWKAGNPLILGMNLIVQKPNGKLKYLQDEIFPWGAENNQVKIFLSGSKNYLGEEEENKFYKKYYHLRSLFETQKQIQLPSISFGKVQGHTEAEVVKSLSVDVLKQAIERVLSRRVPAKKESCFPKEKKLRPEDSEAISKYKVKAVILQMFSGREICVGNPSGRNYDICCYKLLRDKMKEIEEDSRFQDICIIPFFSYFATLMPSADLVESDKEYEFNEIAAHKVILCQEFQRNKNTTPYDLIRVSIEQGEEIPEEFNDIKKLYEEELSKQYSQFLQRQIDILSSNHKKDFPYEIIPSQMWGKLVDQSKSDICNYFYYYENTDFDKYLIFLKIKKNVHATYLRAKTYLRAFKKEKDPSYQKKKKERAIEEFKSISTLGEMDANVWDSRNEAWIDLVREHKKRKTSENLPIATFEWYLKHANKHIERLNSKA